MYDYRCYIDLQCPYRSRKELSEKISARNEMHFRGPETFDEFRIEINRKPMSLCRKFTASKKVSEKDAFFFCYAARLLSIFIFKTSLVFSIVSLREVILQK